MDGIASKILWYFAFPLVLFLVPVKRIWYLLLILEKILPILSTCAVKVSTYPFFIANSQGKQLDFCERTSLFNLKLFLCSIALCMEFVLSPFSFYSGSFGLLPLRLDWEGSSDGVFIYSQCLAHSGHIKTFEK